MRNAPTSPLTRPLAGAVLLALALAACSSGPRQAGSGDTASPAHGQPAADSLTAEVPAPAPSPVPTRAESERGSAAADASRQRQQRMAAAVAAQKQYMAVAAPAAAIAPLPAPVVTERYQGRDDNPVQRASEQPVSTFSIDVDTGSYANVRRMLVNGQLPPSDAVRAEEFINYFDFGYTPPTSADTPFSVTTEFAVAPWNPQRHLLMVGLKGYDVAPSDIPASNLVFLIDTSGSMQSPDKIGLLKQAFAQVVEELRPQDRVAIVAYAGSAGLVLDSTPGSDKASILAAIDRLEAGGSTNGGDGIRLAYAMAKRAFVRDGVNRVILATDGDFNVGTIDGGSLETMVADQRKSGIALTTLGFGAGNYNDHLAERLADAGDGNHAYIDTLQEARKVLVEELSSTLLTIAQDVKIQIEFNPALVAEYRLIGYENRLLAREDFSNDKVDAGDIGAGHEVTALYEITLAGSGAERLPPLRYGGKDAAGNPASGELAHLRLRYKRPGETTSRLIETLILRNDMRAQPSDSMRFAATVAAWADALRGGTHLDGWDWSAIASGARTTQGRDPWKLRAEFAELVEASRGLVAAGETVAEPPQVSSIAR